MAITQSAKKAIRQNKSRRKKNLSYLTNIRTSIKELKVFVAQKKTKEAKDKLSAVYQALDKAAKVGVIKKNAASRKKSRITKFVEKSAK